MEHGEKMDNTVVLIVIEVELKKIFPTYNLVLAGLEETAYRDIELAHGNLQDSEYKKIFYKLNSNIDLLYHAIGSSKLKRRIDAVNKITMNINFLDNNGDRINHDEFKEHVLTLVNDVDLDNLETLRDEYSYGVPVCHLIAYSSKKHHLCTNQCSNFDFSSEKKCKKYFQVDEWADDDENEGFTPCAGCAFCKTTDQGAEPKCLPCNWDSTWSNCYSASSAKCKDKVDWKDAASHAECDCDSDWE